MSFNGILLGDAAPFSVLAGSAITNTGTTTIDRSIGVSPGSSITGSSPTVGPPGTVHAGDAVAADAQADLTTAYNNAAFAPSTADLTGIDLGLFNAANPLPPGVYTFSSSAGLTGNLTLDAGGDPTAVWIFQIGSTLTTASGSSVTFLDGIGCPGRVYWQVGSSATLGTTTSFIGNILALTSITLTTGASINGRALARNGAVTLDNNTITTEVAFGCTGGDPHVLCLDGSRIDVYQEGFYRLFDNCNDHERIIINADIRRNPDNHFDYYNQLWIQIQNDEYLLTFTDNGITINQSPPSASWKHNYTTHDNIPYIFTCESKYNTIGLNIADLNGPFTCSGLLAGQIIPLKTLNDRTITTPRSILLEQYDQNSLLAGSAGPHIITAQKKAIRVSNNSFRLLQWKTSESSGIVNAQLDHEGQIRQLIICSNQNGQPFIQSWKWIGNEHWNLIPIKNNSPLSRHTVCEHKFFLGNDSLILLRTQGNGSFSASFKNVESNVRGLLFGDIITINGLYDLQTYEPTNPLSSQDQTIQTASLYQRLIDPMAI